jgi:hypothetical protein
MVKINVHIYFYHALQKISKILSNENFIFMQYFKEFQLFPIFKLIKNHLVNNV